MTVVKILCITYGCEDKNMSYKSLRQEQQMAAAYLAITQELGPSKQLISFVDYDQKLGLESMSLEDAHITLETQLNPDMMGQAALEDLASMLGNAAAFGFKHLKDGIWGFIRGQVGKAVVLGGISLATVLAGKIRTRMNGGDAEDGVVSHHNFMQKIVVTHSVVNAEKEALLHIPRGFNLTEWETFDRYYGQSIRDVATRTQAQSSKIHEVDFSESGWTKDNFRAAVSTFVRMVEDVEATMETFAKRLDHISKWVKSASKNVDDKETMEISDAIHSSLGGSLHVFEQSQLMLNDLRWMLNKVGHKFEEAK
jgi:uncharacterized protein YukE